MTEPPQPNRRAWVRWTIVGVLVVAVLAVGVPWFYATVIASPAPEPFVSVAAASASASTSNPGAASASPSGSISPPQAQATPDGAALDGAWNIGPGSQAGYRVDEVLSGAQTTVVGRTDQVTGSAQIEGSQLMAAEITVDMASVTTDSSARDGQFNNSIMLTSQYPTATFRLTEPIAIKPQGGTASLAGELTLRGVTVPVTAQVQYSGSLAEGVDVAGQIPITFADWNIEAPSLGFVKVEDTGTVEFAVHLVKA